jgi:hypothetical protein
MMAIFGAVLGIMLAWTGMVMSQDLVIEMNTKGEACLPNPVPLANMFIPTVCSDISAGAGATISGIGWLIFMSLMLVIVIGMVVVAFSFFFVRSLRGGMPAFASFAVFLMVFFSAAFGIMLKLQEVFGVIV